MVYDRSNLQMSDTYAMWGADAPNATGDEIFADQKVNAETGVSAETIDRSLTKGESEGHPFRGNQYTEGQAGDGGWKPTMTRAEAEKWAKNSALQIPLYHGTEKENAKSILANGLRIGITGAFGSGIYSTDDKGEADDFVSSNGKTFELKANVSNIWNLDTMEDVDKFIKDTSDALEKGTLKKDEGESFSDAMRKYAMSLGYDCIRIPFHADNYQYNVLDPKDITVVSDKVTKGDVTGHDFHGNQYTGGTGGTDMKPHLKYIASATSDFFAKGGTIKVFDPKNLTDEDKKFFKQEAIMAKGKYQSLRERNFEIQREQRPMVNGRFTEIPKEQYDKLSQEWNSVRREMDSFSLYNRTLVSYLKGNKVDDTTLLIAYDKDGNAEGLLLGKENPTNNSVEAVASVGDMKHTGTALEYIYAKETAERGVSIRSEQWGESTGYHELIGRTLNPIKGGLSSKWTKAQVQEIASLDIPNAVITKFLIQKGDVAGHPFYGNQWIDGQGNFKPQGGRKPRAPKGDSPKANRTARIISSMKDSLKGGKFIPLKDTAIAKLVGKPLKLGGEFNYGWQKVEMKDGLLAGVKEIRDGNGVHQVFQAQNEVLASAVGKALDIPIRDAQFMPIKGELDANPPDTAPANEPWLSARIVSPWIEGKTAFETPIPDTPEAQADLNKIQFFDQLIGNGDRFQDGVLLNDGNIMVTDDGRVVGIDHAFAFPPTGGLMDNSAPMPDFNLLGSPTREDLDNIHASLMALEPKFESMDRSHDLRKMMNRFQTGAVTYMNEHGMF